MTGFASSHEEDLAKLQKILARLEPGEREALTRFYLLEHDPVRITAELGISDSQLRELKARVRAAYLAIERPN
jgi:DNA-directed RNA polymerase specialized sigma24 family protein